MDDISQAYKTLGLSMDVDRKQVEKRFDVLIRQAKAQMLRGEAIINEDEIQKAYRMIVEYERKKFQDEYDEKTYGKHKKHKDKFQKIDHFLSYYKFHVISSIAALVLIIMLFNSYLDNRAEKIRISLLPPPDLTILFFGYYDQGYEGIEEKLLPLFPDWERIDVMVTYSPTEIQSEYDMAMIQRSTLVLATEKPDIYIVDSDNLQRFLNQGMFTQLDARHLPTNRLLSLPDSQLVMDRAEDDLQSHVYGVDINNGKLPELLPGLGRQMIATIGPFPQDYINAVRFIQFFAEE